MSQLIYAPQTLYPTDYSQAMSTPVLATKLYIPLPRAQLVPRPRLLERLDEGLHRKLTLISAPAGFGKTTLVSEWVARCQKPVAWLSLDEGDSDPARFLTYLITALQTVVPHIGEGLLSALQPPQAPPTEAVLTAMLNALLNVIATIPHHFVLVLDDYHVIGSQPVDQALHYLLEHLPAHMHLLITTREDPNVGLARLRSRDHMTEIRATDLRFTPTEAGEFLNQAMHLNLTAPEVAALETRTEGWIAGLQLAVLSMRGHQDIPRFIQAFAGDHRYIVDYLVEEVLQRQPEPTRGFLLQTAILERLNGSLCDAVTQQSGGKARLETLQRGNFFLIPLDDTRDWYRYHHLFADVLRMHLMSEQPEQVAILHVRASEWYAQKGSAEGAIRHALAAEDFERTADLIERFMPALRQSRQESKVLGWLERLPKALFGRRPVLSVHYAGVLLASGRLEGVEASLQAGERWLERDTDLTDLTDFAERVVVDETEFRSLPGSIAIFRAAHALALGNVSGTMKQAQMALECLPPENQLGRGAAAGLLGLAHWTTGNLEAARQSYTDCLARLQKVGHITDAIGITLALTDICIVQGRLLEAVRLYKHGLHLATVQGAAGSSVSSGLLRGAADMYVGMGELEREHNNLNAATQHLSSSQELGEWNGLPQNPYRWRVAMALVHQAQGDLEGALELLLEAERFYVGDFFPNTRPVAALRTRIWLRQGRLAEALSWVQQQNLSARDDLSFLLEFEHITLARVLLAQSTLERSNQPALEALHLLERLLDAAQEGGRMGSVIEILVLQGLVYQAQSKMPAALGALKHALTLAEPQGYIRMFLDEGAALLQLLHEAARHQILPDFVGKLLAGFAAEQCNTDEPFFANPANVRGQASHDALTLPLEALSQRELQVLRLFSTDLSGPEIAHELNIALSTVRTHTKSIFSKLNAKNRRAAVKRASDLELI